MSTVIKLRKAHETRKAIMIGLAQPPIHYMLLVSPRLAPDIVENVITSPKYLESQWSNSLGNEGLENCEVLDVQLSDHCCRVDTHIVPFLVSHQGHHGPLHFTGESLTLPEGRNNWLLTTEDWRLQGNPTAMFCLGLEAEGCTSWFIRCSIQAAH